MIERAVTHGLVIQPGDTLLLAARSDITEREMEQLRDQLRPELPDNITVVVLGGVEQIATYRPEPGAPCDPA